MAKSKKATKVDQLLASDDPSNVRLAVPLLGDKTLAPETVGLALAAGLFLPDKDVRQEILQALAAGHPKIGKRFLTDKRAYNKIIETQKLVEVCKTVQKDVGVDAGAFALGMVRIFANFMHVGPAEAAISAATRFPTSLPAVFAHVPSEDSVYLEIDGKVPPGMSTLKRLSHLRLDGTGLTSSDNVAELAKTKLTHLELRMKAPGDLKHLSPLSKRLRDLFFAGGKASLSGLEGWTALERLSSYAEVKDLTPLAKVPALVELHLYKLKAKDLSPLFGLKKLTTVTLGNSSLATADIAALRKALPSATITVR